MWAGAEAELQTSADPAVPAAVQAHTMVQSMQLKLTNETFQCWSAGVLYYSFIKHILIMLNRSSIFYSILDPAGKTYFQYLKSTHTNFQYTSFYN